MEPCAHNCRHGVLAIALLVAALMAFPGSASADGDPASDVLVAQSLFLPQDAAIAPARAAQLAALLREAAAVGLPARVAIISSAADLGSVTELWRQPRNYARFLAAELELVYRGPLIVVMPDGYGLAGYRLAASPLAGLPSPGRDLAGAAIAAVQRLASAQGHSLRLPSTANPGASGSSDVIPWLVFAAGWVLVAVAWGASLRARPLSLRVRTGAQ